MKNLPTHDLLIKNKLTVLQVRLLRSVRRYVFAGLKQTFVNYSQANNNFRKKYGNDDSKYEMNPESLL